MLDHKTESVRTLFNLITVWSNMELFRLLLHKLTRLSKILGLIKGFGCDESFRSRLFAG